MKYSSNTKRYIRGPCVGCVLCVQGINPVNIYQNTSAVNSIKHQLHNFEVKMVKEVLNHEELQKELQKAGDMFVIVYLFDSGNLTGQYGKLKAISEMAMLAREHTNVLFLQVLIFESYEPHQYCQLWDIITV